MMFINGQFTSGKSTETIPVINPATEEIIAETQRGTPQDAEQAIAAARAALPIWSRMSAGERAAIMHKAADEMRAHHEQLVRLLTQEEGKPLPENEEELWWTEETLDYYAELGRHQRGEMLPPGADTQINFTLREPWGVVACIVPWNYPLLLLAWKLAPALAAGNTVVIKPSELTPLTTLEMAKTAFQHFPPGVINIVTGYGPETGEPMVTHPDVTMIAFTGSLAIGQRIAGLAAPQMKKLHLELGGKDPMVIAPDIEIDTAVRALSYAALLNTGQVCTSTERVYVHQSIFAQFCEELSDFVSKLRLGNGLDEGVDIGPMIRGKFRDKVHHQIQEAVASGARILTGGRIPDHFERGFFYQPTVMIQVDHSMRIMREETFGPVIPIMPYSDFDQALQLADDNPYGLGASLMSHDVKFVKRFYESVKAGTVWINDPLTDNFAGPFGGMKMSGLGRELGQAGFDEFCQMKHIHWDVAGKIQDYWYPY
ncbi:MAG TPA: aldehyde dehydrogenase family protein [Anaerolineales bacterium]|nr:aldehyde dehydrogenase family protein [Anaerolineales bacterium]